MDATQDTDGVSPISLVGRWIKEIELYEREAEKWETKSKKILRRYKDERTTRESKVARYNILWSNIQTLLPALYSRNPKPDFQRRFLDADPVGRVTCEVLERATSFTLDKQNFHLTMRQCVTDRLLPGRGTIWVRYVPHFAIPDPADPDDAETVANEGIEIDDDAEANSAVDEVEYEEVDLDYVHWCDFGHTVARTWEEVRAVWRICYLTRDELKDRFGDIGKQVPLDYTPEDLKGGEVHEYQKKARIYEIWDSTSKKAIWLSKGYADATLDVRDDPLKLENFFPCPRPMLPNCANDSIIPVPDYIMYQDQANELDDLTSRISLITDAIKVVGVYDSSVPGLQRLLSEGLENRLVPVDQWAAFAEKGGMKGSIELLPMDMIVQTLMSLYDARDKVKADLYEITGMADIIRGSTDADETYGAQKIKANFASIRLEDMQSDVQRFARDAVVLVAEVQANHFSIETLAEISGYPLMTAAEKSVAKQIMQLGGTLPDEMQKPFREPTWEEVTQLLDNVNMRHFRLDIETDSTLKMDQVQEKSDRMDFLEATGKFLESASAAPPVLMPLLGQMLMFAVRAFPVGKQLESCFQETIEQLQQQAKKEEGQPKPDPEMAKVQAQQQLGQAKLQGDMALEKSKQQGDMAVEQAKLQAQQQSDAADRQQQAQLAEVQRQAQMQADQHQAQLTAQLDQMKAANDAALERQRIQFEGQLQLVLQHMRGATAVEVAEIGAGATLDAAQLGAANQSEATQ